jgi:RNA polymerase sigma factor (sigma-70 family)
LDDAELVARARDGDDLAFAELARLHKDAAFRTAYLVTWDAAEAEDATQEAFLAAYEALGRFRADAPFRPWLLRIVTNKASNRRRSALRRVKWALRAAEDYPSAGAAPSPEAEVLSRLHAELVVAALNRLRAEERLVLVHRYLHGLSEAEMADALGCARGTVKSRLSRALARLRAEYAAVAGSAPPARAVREAVEV